MNEFGNPSAEHIEFDCPHCSMRLKVSSKIAGQPAKCPSCSAISTVPSNQTAEPVAVIAPPVGSSQGAAANVSAQPAPQSTVAPPMAPVESRQDSGVDTPIRKLYRKITEEVAKVFVGQDELVQGTLVALFSGGHVLIESVPGLGKTLFVRTLG